MMIEGHCAGLVLILSENARPRIPQICTGTRSTLLKPDSTRCRYTQEDTFEALSFPLYHVCSLSNRGKDLLTNGFLRPWFWPCAFGSQARKAKTRAGRETVFPHSSSVSNSSSAKLQTAPSWSVSAVCSSSERVSLSVVPR